ncbi:acyl-CoA dehydrogenase family protein [Microbacterium sp. CPCC 204701]|uniref:acyl-CoA dehydrogenase family protein n=1 Tax=Microbacterium sp. CPCC 204701 TaxID=2493084 RepID=UPI000FD7224B|nr:acyl-CoA dehydrogenase family protein [Microbacterium sp. CPCC 204701]
MDFTESEDEQRFRLELRSWLEANIPTEWREREGFAAHDETFLREWSAKLADAGWVGLTWPVEYGGRGLAPSYQNIYLEELARADAPDHVNVIGIGFAGPTIINWGTEEQKATYLPAILRGDEVWCQGFSEPGAGSDLGSARTKAVLDGDEWVVNGQKVWSSFAHMADRCILVVRTEPHAPKHLGLSFLLVDMKSPGIDVRPLPQITGVPEFNEMFFDDVRVPRDSMLGARGEGWKVAMTTLRHERGTAAMGMALSLEKQLSAFFDFLVERDLTEDPRLREALGDAWVRLHALRFTNMRMLSDPKNVDGVPGPESSVAKLTWSDANQALTKAALDAQGLVGGLDGADAWSNGFWQGQRLRARANTIEGGSSEILKNVIAERVLGLPRSR